MARPYRSVLYIPAANARAMEKAQTLPADAIIFDLEDAVAPGEKPAARDALPVRLPQGRGDATGWRRTGVWTTRGSARPLRRMRC